jgi:hypothetical protein
VISYTSTDQRRRDQELRFTVHDSADYHQLKVSVFNDDKKTELIGETWASLEAIMIPGGGQIDAWHGLTCRGKYAGEIRIEMTFYDSRQKAEKTGADKNVEIGRIEGPSPPVGGPRQSTSGSIPIKRRPLPSDPTVWAPSPVSTPDQRVRVQTGPRSYGAPPAKQQQRAIEPAPTQRSTPLSEVQPLRRPVPDAATPTKSTPPASTYQTPQQETMPQQQTPQQQTPQQQTPQPQQQTPQQQTPQQQTPQHQASQHQQRPSRSSELELYSASPNPPRPTPTTLNSSELGFDMSYTAPKLYEVQPVDPAPQHVHDFSNRTMSQDDFRSSQGHGHPQRAIEHSYSAPNVTTLDAYEPAPLDRSRTHFDNYDQSLDLYQEPSYHVEPLRMSRNSNQGYEQVSPNESYQDDGYMSSQSPYDDYDSHGRPNSAMQPTVEDEDDVPPPPPMHRSDASTISQHHDQPPPDYHEDSYRDDSPAPLNFARYREEPAQIEFESPPQSAYESQSQSYDSDEYAVVPHSAEHRYSYSRASPQPMSRPVSRDTMDPSPLRQETALIPASLIAGFNPARPDHRLSMTMTIRGNNRASMDASTDEPEVLRDSLGHIISSSYDTPSRLRQRSEPDYRDSPHYESPLQPYQSQQLVHRNSYTPTESSDYYQHAPPQELRHTSPTHESAPIVKPRAVSPAPGPGYAQSSVNNRSSRGPTRTMPTRKSVSPRPPPSKSEKRFSAYGPDSFDMLNPVVSRSPNPGNGGNDEPERPGSSMEYNDKGQIVTFSGRVIDASDHLPVDSWAPEPERKETKKVHPPRERAGLNGARDLEAAKAREDKYRREREERERIRQAASASFGSSGSPSNALVSTRQQRSYSRDNRDISPAFRDNSPVNEGAMVLASSQRQYDQYDAVGRNRLQKQRPESSFNPGARASPSHIPGPSHVLRERENVGGYGSSPSYGRGSRQSISGPPPIPAKVPMDSGYGNQSEDMMALSMELQSIDIGPGSAGRSRGTTKRTYGRGY